MRILSRQSIFEPSRAGAGHLFGYGIIYVLSRQKTVYLKDLHIFWATVSWQNKTSQPVPLLEGLASRLVQQPPNQHLSYPWQRGISCTWWTRILSVTPFCWGQSPPGVSLFGGGEHLKLWRLWTYDHGRSSLAVIKEGNGERFFDGKFNPKGRDGSPNLKIPNKTGHSWHSQQKNGVRLFPTPPKIKLQEIPAPTKKSAYFSTKNWTSNTHVKSSNIKKSPTLKQQNISQNLRDYFSNHFIFISQNILFPPVHPSCFPTPQLREVPCFIRTKARWGSMWMLCPGRGWDFWWIFGWMFGRFQKFLVDFLRKFMGSSGGLEKLMGIWWKMIGNV